MRLYKQSGSPYWYVEFTDPVDKRVRRRSTKQIKQSAAFKAALEIVKAPSATDTLTLTAALERYMALLQREKRPSARWLKTMLTRTVNGAEKGRFSLPPDMPIASLTPRHMDDLVGARLAEGLAPQTVAHEVHAIRAAVNHASDLGFTYPKAMESRSGRSSPWRTPRLTQKTRYLSHKEWQAVYDRLAPDRPVFATYRNGKTHSLPVPPELIQSRQDIQDMFVLLTLSGGRWSEVARLTWDRIDTEAFSWLRLWGSKTGKERVTALPEQAARVLKRRFESRQSIEVFPGKGGSGFRTQSSATPIIKAMDDCGLNRADIIEAHGRATVHSLRHTYASWLLQGGADLAEVQEALGHQSLEMTRRYAHLSQSVTARKIRGILRAVGVPEVGHERLDCNSPGCDL